MTLKGRVEYLYLYSSEPGKAMHFPYVSQMRKKSVETQENASSSNTRLLSEDEMVKSHAESIKVELPIESSMATRRGQRTSTGRR